jgi:hypothetical protein
MTVFSSNTYTFIFYIDKQYRMNIYNIHKNKKKQKIIPKKYNPYPKLCDSSLYEPNYDFGYSEYDFGLYF